MARSQYLISILDDSPEDRAAVRRQLAEDPTGYSFTEHDSLAEAVESFRSMPPDCLLLDYGLAGSDGAHGNY